MNAFEKQSLDAHNKYRSLHQAPPLTWSPELQKSAQAWADHLAKAGVLQHAPKDKRQDCGENIYMKSSSGPLEVSGDEATDNWYSEVKKYNFSKGGWQGGSGHFTQVVWKESKEFAVAKAMKGNRVYVVGRYRPAGNLLSAFDKNVFPAK